jgi:hypothetical protein
MTAPLADHRHPAMIRRGSPGLTEAFALWGLFALVAVEIFVTYTRTPVRELYHVTRGGTTAGAHASFGFLGHAAALMSLGVLPIVVDRLRLRTVLAAAGVSAALVGTIFIPGALGDDTIDARPINVLPVLGVAITLALSFLALRRTGLNPLRRQRGDRTRVVVAAVLIVGGLPWIAADMGLSLSLPVLRWLYQTDQLRSQPGIPGLHQAVHDGHHHGMDGVLLALSALLLSRAIPFLRTKWLRHSLAAYLAFQLAYGLGNAVQDFQMEQIVKRGLMRYELPYVISPAATRGFAVVLLVALAIYLLALRRLAIRPAASGRSLASFRAGPAPHSAASPQRPEATRSRSAWSARIAATANGHARAAPPDVASELGRAQQRATASADHA